MNAGEFSSAAVLEGLTQFQQRTVSHVVDRFYGSNAGTRFLVADETGLGKTMVARGVIARTIEHLQHVSTVDRIDIVYVCSNTDIATQNLKKLEVTGTPSRPVASRLTLLAKHSRHFQPMHATESKPVNLISFTPGTSFERGHNTGKAEERAMLYLLLEGPMDLRGASATAAQRLLQRGIGRRETFRNHILWLRQELAGDVDPIVSTAFFGAAERDGLIRQFSSTIDEMGRKQNVPDDLWHRMGELIANMRATLARESVHLLEPDLIILDEFQRFRQLLDPSSEAGELAHHLFNHQQARVLLLSATPYKPFTYAEESAEEDHHTNFMETVRFLADTRTHVFGSVETGLRNYRDALVKGKVEPEVLDAVRQSLLAVMTRTERPKSVGETMGIEIDDSADGLSGDDLLGYVVLREIGRTVSAPTPVEYWKSAPYFVNFMDGYKIATHVREALADPTEAPRVRELLQRTQRLDAAAMRAYGPVDMGNPRLRKLASDTVDAGWWKLLWLPPSLPYLEPDGPFAEPFAANMTKRLVFSSWTATPTAIASLLSYAAERHAVEGSRLSERTAEARRSMRSRLGYRTTPEGRPQSMTNLALFWPMTALAAVTDPRDHARRAGRALSQVELQASIEAQLGLKAGPASTPKAASESASPLNLFRYPGSLPQLNVEDVVLSLSGEVDAAEESEADEDGNLRAHVEAALATEHSEPRALSPAVLHQLVEIGAHAPGNIALRALGRVAEEAPSVTQDGLWKAAAVLASGLRSLFGRPETTALLDQLVSDDMPYWQAVLTYCTWGNLQAVLDEYLHNLASTELSSEITDASIQAMAATAAAAIALRPSRYEAFDADNPEVPISLPARFALRYGGRRQQEENARLPHVRSAFNSPFWPMVLATTSVGQEGVDFHWWCHAVTHWNTPANPVDFEQREGRIDRYNGHAVRRNIAERHGDAMLASEQADPWKAGFILALDEQAQLGEFAPNWVYPGSARIERHVAPYALSVDQPRLERIKRDVALYRLTFGQPRQEDMLALLHDRYDSEDPDALRSVRLNLSPD